MKHFEMNPPEVPVKPEPSNTDQDQNMNLCATLFYDHLADTTVRLKGGKIIKFNRGALIIHARSKILCNIFHENLKDSDVIDIPDIDYDLFKLFLDCFMGFEPYTFDNALKIYPISFKYGMKNSTDECTKSLQIRELTPKLCEVLNMAVCNMYYVDLINQICGFIQSTGSFYKILENEEYCYLLEPKTMYIILLMQNIESIDSHLLKIIMKWAENHIKTNQHSCSKLKNFLKKYELLRFVTLDCFETTGAIAEFGFSDIGKGFFTLSEILSHLQNSRNLVHGKSEWKAIKKNESVTEEIFIPIFLKSYPAEVFNYVNIRIERNKVVFYENFEENGKIMTCNVALIGQNGASGVQLFALNMEFQSLQENFNSMIYGSGTVFKGFSFPSPSYVSCILRITWTFFYDCRVLLMNRQGDVYNSSNKMYYSKDIAVVIKNWVATATNGAIAPQIRANSGKK